MGINPWVALLKSACEASYCLTLLPLLHVPAIQEHENKCLYADNTKLRGRITVQLTSCLFCFDLAA